MHFRSSVERHRRWRSVGVVGLAVVALGLSACSPGVSGSAGAGAAGSKPSAPAAKVSITAGNSGNVNVNPNTPVVVNATNGKLTTVTMTNTAKGNTVKG